MISWEYFAELALRFIARPKIKDKKALKRFFQLKGEYSRVCAMFLPNRTGSVSDSVGYNWAEWATKIRSAFQKEVPLGFLSHPTIVRTMVYRKQRGVLATRKKILTVEFVYGKSIARCLLKEDYIGLPTISNLPFLTSANRAHHAFHLARYKEITGVNFWDCSSIIEWGGGYGNMACIIRKMNPGITYIVIDLPEILSLQYVYLGSIFGNNSINIVNHDIVNGKINLVSTQTTMEKGVPLKCDGFLSTWALTESPKSDQLSVIERNFFDAKRVLMASRIDDNNLIRNHISTSKLQTISVPTGFGIDKKHQYWFK